MGRRAERLHPAASIVTNQTQLYIAMGILGATVMPHNLYLHTAVVQSRPWTRTSGQARGDQLRHHRQHLALTLALLINSAILITAAAVFHARATPRSPRSAKPTSC